MVIILVILTIAVFTAIELMRRSKRPVPVSAGGSPAAGFTEGGERYVHPGHCWVWLTEPDLATVGTDDFTQHFVGTVDTVDLPPEGSLVHQGQPFINLHHGSKTLMQVAPLTGIVKQVNNKLQAHPAFINRTPLEKGWIAKITPINLRLSLNNLLRSDAAESLQEAARAQLLAWFSPKLGSVLQDGGTLVENISDLLTDQEWNTLAGELYPPAGQLRNPSTNDTKEHTV